MQNVSYRFGKCRFNICPARFRSLFQSIGNSFFHKFVIRKIGNGDMSLARPFFIVFNGCFNRSARCAPNCCLATPPITSHIIAERMILSTRSLPSRTRPKPPLMDLADSDTAAVVQCAEAHAPCGIAREALNRHIRHYIAAVLDVRSLAEGGIRTADVVVVASDHNRTDFAAANHFVEFQARYSFCLRHPDRECAPVCRQQACLPLRHESKYSYR